MSAISTASVAAVTVGAEALITKTTSRMTMTTEQKQ